MIRDKKKDIVSKLLSYSSIPYTYSKPIILFLLFLFSHNLHVKYIRLIYKNNETNF